MEGNITNNLPVAGGQSMHSGASQAAHAQAAAGGHGQQQSRLKVEDALSYLEMVKLKYDSKPHVYNEFLEVMKDFKSQSINTHGVIQRVSQLFQENVDLILGFNTFLPPEYRIEINPNTEAITLHQPSAAGMQQIAITPGNVNRLNANNQQATTTYSGAPNRLAVSSSHSTASIASSSTSEQQTSVAGSLQSTHHGVAATIGIPQHHANVLHNAMHFGAQGGQGTQVGTSQQSAMTHLVAASIQPQAVAGLGGRNAQAQSGAGSQQQPVEFDHAISYVNKIKHRFSSQPDIYKMFLDILHTYQKEQRALRESGLSAFPPGHRPLSEAEVYQKVAQLFRGQEDLLQEFGQFLPDTNAFALQAAHNAALLAAGASRHDDSPLGMHMPPASLQQQPALMSGSHIGVAHNVQVDPATAQSGASSLQSSLMPRYAAQPNATAATQRYGAPISASYQSQSMGAAQQAGRVLGSSASGSGQRMGLAFLGGVASSASEQAMAGGAGALSDVHGGSMRDSAVHLFEQIRATLRPLGAWDDFVRCLKLYNDEVIGRADLLLLVNRSLARHPELGRQLNEFLDISKPHTGGVHPPYAAESDEDESETEEEDDSEQEEEEGDGESDGGEYAFEDGGARAGRTRGTAATGQRQMPLVRIDYASLKQCGVSYRALPPDYPRARCGGRTNAAYAHANEVLNDVWVSLPAWSEGDSQAGSNRKTQVEELLYRLEDERFELDNVIQLNTDTLRLFEYVHTKLNRMSADERSRFRFVEYLSTNEHSNVLYRRAVERLYGDKAHEVLETLRRAPTVALPVVIGRLRQKDEEWREAQRQFNRLWREQQARYALRALDVQGATIKQNDLKNIRLRYLLGEIERAFEEREKVRRRAFKASDTADRDGSAPNSKGSQTRSCAEVEAEPHLTFYYARDKRLYEDACGLIVHHVKRQVTCCKEEKSKMKYIAKQALQEMLFQTPFELSDDEEQQSSDEERDADQKPPLQPTSCTGADGSDEKLDVAQTASELQCAQTQTETDVGVPPNVHVFYCNLLWYVFLRLHQILCDRLSRIWQHSRTLIEQYEAEERAEANIRAAAQRQADAAGGSQQVAAVALRLRAQRSVNPRSFYDNFLELVRNVLDGEIDNTQFEDELRELYTTKAYHAYAVDRIIQNTVRHLQTIAQDEKTCKLLKIYHAEERRARGSSNAENSANVASAAAVASASATVTVANSYQDRVRQTLNDGECETSLSRSKKDPPAGVKLTFELLETPDDTESGASTSNDEDDVNDKEKQEDADDRAPSNSKVHQDADEQESRNNANAASSQSERGEAEEMDTASNERSTAPKRKRKAPAPELTESDSNRDAPHTQAKVRAIGKEDADGSADLVKRTAVLSEDDNKSSVLQFDALHSWSKFVDRFAFEGQHDAAACRSNMSDKNRRPMLLRSVRDFVRKRAPTEHEQGDAAYSQLAHTTTSSVLVDRPDTTDSRSSPSRLTFLVLRRRTSSDMSASEANLRRVKRTALRCRDRWVRTHLSWLTKNASASQSTTSWFLAKYEDDERTLKQVVVANNDRPPFTK